MYHPKLNLALKTLSLISGIVLISLSFLIGGISLGEGYNIFNPYADTEFAKDYSPEKFKDVKEGMHLAEIIAITGEPLNINYDTTTSMFNHTYTRDGYLGRRHDMNFSLCGDLAWYGSSVSYNKDSIAVKVYSGWHYD